MMGTRALFWAISTVYIMGMAQVCTAGGNNGFTFKRVTVEKRALGKRINVQIKQEDDYYKNLHKEQQAKAAAKPKAKPKTVVKAAPKADLYDWFWASVSPALDKASSGRLSQALLEMQKHPDKLAALSPSLTHFQKLVDQYGTNILLASLGKQISPAFVLAVIGVESSGRSDAVSSAGAVGVMQLIPATAARFNVTDSTDAQQNINGGTAYLDWLLKEFKRDPLLALAGYNAGENAVKKHGGVPPYAETRAYVPKVVAAWQVARALCITPPKYVTDGCVFRPRTKK